MNPSHQLLRQYVTQGDDVAFRELVTSHVNLVYSAALRVLQNDKGLAEDVVQAVFTELAKKAGTISEDVILSGWLYRTAIHLATRRQRTEMRRQHREREAVAMQALEESDGELWASVAPELDAAMNQLNERERNAIVLRYFERQDHRSVGAMLGLTDDAAQKCVSRALDKLRAVLNSKGIRSTASVLSMVLLANSLQAAPAALVQRLPGRALAGAATSAGWFARWKLAAAAAGLIATGSMIPLVVSNNGARNSSPETVQVTSTLATAGRQEPQPSSNRIISNASPLVSEIVRQAAVQLRGGSQNVTATTNALNLLSKIPLDQVQRALSEVAMVQDTAAQALLYKYLLGRWAESNPNEAMAYSREKLPHACRSSGMEGILDAWSVRNTTAALEWTGKSLAVAEGNDSLLTTLYRNVAHQDLNKAFVMLAALESAGDRSYALRGIMTNVNDAEHRTQLLDQIGKLEDQDMKLQSMRSLVERWADHDAPAAAEWILRRESEHERSRLMDSLGLVWLQRQPQAAADWWFGHVPDSSTLTKIVNIWAHQDPNSAGVWLNKHATGPVGDDARMTFARQVQEVDPESAFAWAETITLAELREATVAHVYRAWKSRAPAEAAQFLEKAKSSWPAQRVQQLESQPKPQP